MERSDFYYVLLGFLVACVPLITDCLLKDRVNTFWRLTLSLVAVASVGAFVALAARRFGF